MKYYFAHSAEASNLGIYEVIEAETKIKAMVKANRKIADNIENFYAWYDLNENHFYATRGCFD